jgi:hypothetical protein
MAERQNGKTARRQDGRMAGRTEIRQMLDGHQMKVEQKSDGGLTNVQRNFQMALQSAHEFWNDGGCNATTTML